jgi:hypothetical protein
MNEILLCKVCLEPISNFICPDCLYKAIQQWLWRYEPSIIANFKDFHKAFIDSTISEQTAKCIVCKQDFYHMICSYDYMKEAYSWLEDHLNKKRLKEFLHIFSLGFRKIDRRASGWFFYRNKGPLPENNNSIDIGLCEVCDNFSYNLKYNASNHMVCENCR